MRTDSYDIDLLHGVREISKVLGPTERQTYHLIRDGRVPAFKLGGTLCSRRSVLHGWLEQQLPQR